MNPLQISKTGGTRSDDKGDCIPESRSSRSRRPTPKTPKSMAGLENLKSESDSYNSDNDIEPGLNIKNIKVPSLRDTPEKVIEYIKEITSMNKALMMKVKSLNGYVHVLNAKEDDSLNNGTHLRKTVKELTDELENYKRSRRFNANSLKSGQKFNKTAAVDRNVTKENKKVTKENYDMRTTKTIKSKAANTQLTKNREPKKAKNKKAGSIATRTVTQKPHETKKPKAMNIPQKPSITTNRKSKEPAAPINAKSQSTTTKKTLKESVGSQNTIKISKSTESSTQESVDNKISLADVSNITKLTERPKQDSLDNKISLADINNVSVSKKISSRYSSSSPEDVTARTRTTSSNTIHTEFSSPQRSKESFSLSIEEELSISKSISSRVSSRVSSSSREDGTVRTRTISSSTIDTEFSSLRSLDRSKESLSTSIEEELSIYSCSSPEMDKLMIQKGGQKTDKATAAHSTSTPDVPHSIKKISSVNSNHTVIKNIKRQGLKLTSLIEYPKINQGSLATPPKIKSSSSVFESPQKRFQMAKKVGAAPLPNLMKDLPSLPGRFIPKPPASPRPDTKTIKLPSLPSQTKFYKRQD